MKVLKVLKNIVIDFFIVILLVSIVFGILNKNKPISLFNYYFFTVMSGSMEETLHVGDNIIVKEEKEYKVGDIVTYKKDNFYVTHRIVKIEGNQVTTKGDANKLDDPPFDKKTILGKFVYKSEWLNFLVRYKIPIALGLIIIFLIESIIRPKKKKVIDYDAS